MQGACEAQMGSKRRRSVAEMGNWGSCGPHFHDSAAAAVEAGGVGGEVGIPELGRCWEMEMAPPAHGGESSGDSHRRRI